MKRVGTLIIMLDAGCSLSDEDTKKMCNFLLSATLDQNAVEYNASAFGLFQKVWNKKLKLTTKLSLNLF